MESDVAKEYDSIASLYEAEGITQDVQEVAKGLEKVDEAITYAEYIAALHALEIKYTFWQTLALTVLSFLIFGILAVIMLLLLS
jgi:hypothetical protein